MQTDSGTPHAPPTATPTQNLTTTPMTMTHGRRPGHAGAAGAGVRPSSGSAPLVQGLGGFWTGSLGLISDSLENLNDLVANLLSLTSLLVANRREPSDRFAYGWHRLEVFNTLLGAGMLLALAAGIVVEACAPAEGARRPYADRLGAGVLLPGAGPEPGRRPDPAPPGAGELERDASLKSAYLHAFFDSLASLALLASTLVIRFTGWRWMDPAGGAGDRRASSCGGPTPWARTPSPSSCTGPPSTTPRPGASSCGCPGCRGWMRARRRLQPQRVRYRTYQ